MTWSGRYPSKSAKVPGQGLKGELIPLDVSLQYAKTASAGWKSPEIAVNRIVLAILWKLTWNK